MTSSSIINKDYEHFFYIILVQLVGVTVFAIIYWLINTQTPDQHFSGLSKDATPLDYLYYSITTQTTVGYGDIHPVSPLARSVAVLQMVVVSAGIGLAAQMMVWSFNNK